MHAEKFADGGPGDRMTAQANEIQWYIARDGKQNGPLTDIEMRTFVAHHYLRLSDLVWRPGMKDWQAAPKVFPTAFEVLDQEPLPQVKKFKRAAQPSKNRADVRVEPVFGLRQTPTDNIFDDIIAQSKPKPEPSQTAPGGIFDDIITCAESREKPSVDKGPEGLTPKAEPSPEPRKTIDARAMRGSLFGTWVKLILLGLVWLAICGAISMPVFGPAALAEMGAALFLVPVLGTIGGVILMGGGSKKIMRHTSFKPVADDHPLMAMTQGLVGELGIPMPTVGTVDVVNAYAMGTNWSNACVAVGEPLLQMLSPTEAAAVVGHELGHVISGDMARMVMMRNFQNGLVFLMPGEKGKQCFRYLTSFFSEMMILSNSRKREFFADAVGAALVSKEAMISALRKLENGPPLTQTEDTYARFMARGRWRGMFSTHPSFDDRVTALEEETYKPRLRWKS